MADISLEAVSKTYDGLVEAVRSVDLRISKGEFVILVGPSGCGKSTILRMIAGLEDVTSGNLYIGGKRVNDTPPKDRDIAMVFQNFALYPHMTVAQNMGFGLKLRGIPGTEAGERVHDAAALLGIEDLLDRRPGELSGGQRQRVALGRAIVRKPRVFLFDEPLSNLDARLRVQMRMELSRLHQRLGTTMMYVTHDQVEAMTMGERIVVLDGGRIQQFDAPLSVYAHPANRFVAGFIGSPAMNFVTCRVRRSAGKLVLSCPPWGLEASLTGPSFDFLEHYLDVDLILGLRPEHVTDRLPPGRQHGYLTGTFRLDVVEPMGNEVVLHLSRNGHDVVARIPPRHVPAVGFALEAGLDLEYAHFFDADSGVNLRAAQDGNTPA